MPLMLSVPYQLAWLPEVNSKEALKGEATGNNNNGKDKAPWGNNGWAVSGEETIYLAPSSLECFTLPKTKAWDQRGSKTSKTLENAGVVGS